ncbi:MAG: hypothetical protein JWM59_1117 [Verrucomicrobiales bacterium]|nr:hypothetical protein [Verrucomicrobiales bacterium]
MPVAKVQNHRGGTGAAEVQQGRRELLPGSGAEAGESGQLYLGWPVGLP